MTVVLQRKRAKTVSVIIPTTGRSELFHAVNSALKQTYPILEIIIVADATGPINHPMDPRVRLLRVGPGVGGNAARQHGIENATGQIIALLDDDDEWFVSKIEAQLQLLPIDSGDHDVWVGTCRVEARGLTSGMAIWPDKLIQPTENLIEYLFRKTKIRGGTGFAQSSTLIFPRELAIRVPFDSSLRFHQDIGWLVDLVHSEPTLHVYQSREPLAIYQVSLGTGSVSQKISSLNSLDWAVQRLTPDGKRILGDFLLTHTLILSRRANSLSGALATIQKGLSLGRPGLPAMSYAAVTVIKILVSKLNMRSQRLLADRR